MPERLSRRPYKSPTGMKVSKEPGVRVKRYAGIRDGLSDVAHWSEHEGHTPHRHTDSLHREQEFYAREI